MNACLLQKTTASETYHRHRQFTRRISLQNVGTVDHEVVFETIGWFGGY